MARRLTVQPSEQPKEQWEAKVGTTRNGGGGRTVQGHLTSAQTVPPQGTGNRNSKAASQKTLPFMKQSEYARRELIRDVGGFSDGSLLRTFQA